MAIHVQPYRATSDAARMPALRPHITTTEMPSITLVVADHPHATPHTHELGHPITGREVRGGRSQAYEQAFPACRQRGGEGANPPPTLVS